MKKQILQISVMQSAKVIAAIYLVTSIPIVACIALFMSSQIPGAAGMVTLIILPMAYAFGGFIGSVIAALIYNLVAARIGGIEFTTAEVGAAAH